MGIASKFSSIGAVCLALVGPTESFGLIIGDGDTYYPLTAEWWQWALSYPSSSSPMLDTNGSVAHLGDHGSVFFLAGSFAGSPITRTFNVPVGKQLFFPVANNIGFQDVPTDTEDSLRQLADTSNIFAYYASLDGTPIASQATRQKSPLFTLQSPLLPEFGICYPSACPSTYTGLAVSDGYWLTLAPLSRGVHTINFGAIFSDGTSLDITDYVNAVPEPGTYALMFVGIGLVAWASLRSTDRKR
jgi:hypothetical protein